MVENYNITYYQLQKNKISRNRFNLKKIFKINKNMKLIMIKKTFLILVKKILLFMKIHVILNGYIGIKYL